MKAFGTAAGLRRAAGLFLRRLAKVSLKGLLVFCLIELVLRCVGFLYLAYASRWLWPESPAPAGVVRIVFFGESTLEGNASWEGSPDGRGRDQPDPFPAQLERLLNGQGAGVGYECVNLGISGITTKQILWFIKGKLRQLKPDIVVIQAGHNVRAPSLFQAVGLACPEGIYLALKGLRTYRLAELAWDVSWLERGKRPYIFRKGIIQDLSVRITVPENADNLRLIVDAAVASGSKVVLCGYFQSGANEFLKKLSLERRVPYCNVELNPPLPELLATDGWHPNWKGCRYIAERLLETLRENGWAGTPTP